MGNLVHIQGAGVVHRIVLKGIIDILIEKIMNQPSAVFILLFRLFGGFTGSDIKHFCHPLNPLIGIRDEADMNAVGKIPGQVSSAPPHNHHFADLA